MAKKRTAATVGNGGVVQTADGWYEAAATTTVRSIEEEVAKSTPIPMPVRPDPDDIERQPKNGGAPFSLSEGLSTPPSAFLTNSAAAPETKLVGDLSVMPFCATGKLITQMSATSAGHGTAFVLGYRLVFTAAHCVEGGSAVTFIPNFAGSTSGVRAWRMKYWFIHHKYLQQPGGDLRYDFAICITEPTDQPVMPHTGNLGWLSIPHGQQEGTSVGYPSDPPKAFGFDGNRMWRSRGAFLRTDADLTAMRNAMTRGCSGGPIVVNLGVAGGWRAVGLNSHVRDFNEDIMYSPVFDEDFAYMIEAARKKEREFNGDVQPGNPDYVRFV